MNLCCQLQLYLSVFPFDVENLIGDLFGIFILISRENFMLKSVEQRKGFISSGPG